MPLRSDRSRALKRYGSLYRRINGDQCVYCGDPSGTADHIPAINWLYAMGSQWAIDHGIELVLVPACNYCNSELSDRPLHTLDARRAHIKQRLAALAGRIRCADWDAEEIGDLGRGLGEFIKTRAQARDYLLRRIAFTGK